MFTGIIEARGEVIKVEQQGTNKTFWINSPVSNELKVDQSVSHNGVCLTVERIHQNSHQVTAVHETLMKTNLGQWKHGDTINLERCLLLNGRLDGHLVQGHVDAVGTLLEKTDLNGSWQFTFSYPPEFAALVIEKGSVSLNGISLTMFNVRESTFDVAVIPYTYLNTNVSGIEKGGLVNLEFDMMGKYVSRILQLQRKADISL